MRVGSLFSGIGLLDLGLEWAGMRTVWMCEQDEFCQRVLRKRFQGVMILPDITQITMLPQVDVIAGGFPCQPVSLAGKGLAQEDERWLWPDFERIIRMVRPRYVIVENVPGLFTRGFGDVLGGLAALGYNAEWGVLSACAMGAPHSRPRVFFIAHTASERLARRIESETTWAVSSKITSRYGIDGSPWENRPPIPRVGYGRSDWMDRLRSLGNAVVPQCAQIIGERVMELERKRSE